MASRLVLALDETDPARALSIAKEVSPFVAKIKINYPLVLSAGLDIVTKISEFENRMRLKNNVIKLKRKIAQYVFDENKYPF